MTDKIGPEPIASEQAEQPVVDNNHQIVVSGNLKNIGDARIPSTEEADIQDAEIVKEWKKGEDEPGLPVVQETHLPSTIGDTAQKLILDELAAEEAVRRERKKHEEILSIGHQKAGFSALPPESVSQETKIPDPVVASVPETPAEVSAADNTKCLEAIARLYEINDIARKEELSTLVLVDNAGQAPLAPSSLLVRTSSNTALLAKGQVEFQDNQPLNSADAFEGAILAWNDFKSYPDGVYLHGEPRDRYMLMLAAQHVNMKVANPVTVDAATRAEVEEQWFVFLAKKASPDIAAPVVDKKITDIEQAAQEMTGKRTPVTMPDGRIEPYWDRNSVVPA